jgi:hypothetical protein
MKRAILLIQAIVLTALLGSFGTARAQTAGPDGHYYAVVLEPNLLWEDARIEAAASTFNGLHGYLATITSQEEDQFIDSLRRQVSSNSIVWVGASQHTNALSSGDGWVWINGEGVLQGQNGGATYSNWLPGEPNDAGGPNSEQFLAVGSSNRFGWSSEPDNRQVQGYVVEYPGSGTQDSVSVVAIDPIAIESPLSEANTNIAYFEFRRGGNRSLDLPIIYSIHGTAVNGSDYDEISQSIIVPAGESSVRLSIVPRADAVAESMETVGIRIEPSLILTPEASYTIVENAREAGAVIYNNRAPAFGALEIAVPRTGMAYRSGESVVLLAALSFSNVIDTVDFYTGNIRIGSAAPVGATNGLAFYRFAWNNPPGESNIIVTARAAQPGGIQLTSSPVHIGILGQTPPSMVRIRVITPDPASAVPDADYAFGYFEISRGGSTAQDLPVYYTVSGSATAGLDYERLQGYVVIGAGRTTAKIPIEAIDDAIAEQTETVILTLVPPGGATNNPFSNYLIDPTFHQAGLEILDNDLAHLPTISITASASQIHEVPAGSSNSLSRITISRTGNVGAPQRVYLDYGADATPLADYAPAPKQIIIPSGRSSYVFFVSASEDNLIEGRERLIIYLSQPDASDPQDVASQPYKIDPDRSSAIIDIFDENATAPVVSLSVIEQTTREPQGNELVPSAVFGIQRTGSTSNALTVRLRYSGSATIGQDYLNPGVIVQIPPGQTLTRAEVHALPDNFIEGDEIVRIAVDSPLVASNSTPSYAFSTNEFVDLIIKDSPAGRTNTPPFVTVAQPVDGAVFLQGETIGIIEDATDPDGSISLLELLLDDAVLYSTNHPPLRFPLQNLAVGPHTLRARAIDNQNAVVTSLPVRILVRHPDSVSFVKRSLPRSYSPSNAVTVELHASPLDGTYAYGVEDQFPATWQVGQISDGGGFDSINRKIKFGPFTDSASRTLTYTLLPSSNATGRLTFTGSSSLNGSIYPIGGDDSIDFIEQFHPADTNADSSIVLAETTAYAAVWKSGGSWPAGPNPIPLGYVTSAGSIWKRGESYRFDPSRGPAPACWVPLSASSNIVLAAQLVPAAQRSILGTVAAGQTIEIHLSVAPPANGASFAVEERPPRGWLISQISDDGTFDPAAGVIRWGVFFDSNARTLDYKVTLPAGITSIGDFNGEFSFDGRIVPVLSTNSLVVRGDLPMRIIDAKEGTNGVTLSISGPGGQPAVIETCPDLQTWSDVQSIFIPNGEIQIMVELPPSANRQFFRLRAQ